MAPGRTRPVVVPSRDDAKRGSERMGQRRPMGRVGPIGQPSPWSRIALRGRGRREDEDEKPLTAPPSS